MAHLGSHEVKTEVRNEVKKTPEEMLSELNNNKDEFDKLQLYFSEPYVINENITIYQPTIGDIIVQGENIFYNTLYIFILNTTSYRLQLWDKGIDWNKISDFELFCMLIKGVNPKISQILFKDIDFQGFDLYSKKVGDTEVVTLYNKDQNIEIDENTYNRISQYLRTMFNIFPKVEKTKGRTTKEWLIEEERDKLKVQKNNKSSLLPLISAYINHPGTKYKTNELRNVGIYEFMDSIQRIQIYESTVAASHGVYSGMVEIKDPEAFNFFREVKDR